MRMRRGLRRWSKKGRRSTSLQECREQRFVHRRCLEQGFFPARAKRQLVALAYRRWLSNIESTSRFGKLPHESVYGIGGRRKA